jgi:hypothetical protein
MKLHILPARQGLLWVKQGARTFFRQPLALSGLFFIFMALMSVLSLVPVLGNALALGLLPAATLGLMAATQMVTKGEFPKPLVLFTGLRSGRKELRAMVVLGALYAAAILLTLAVSALVDGGKFAKIYLLGGSMDADILQDGGFKSAAVLAMAIYLPVSLLFWHAPALVHWHGVSPVKSLFFSAIACGRNMAAYLVYSLVWFGLFLGVSTAAALLAMLIGGEEAVAAVLFPCGLAMAAMFFTSLYFTFADSFEEGTDVLA